METSAAIFERNLNALAKRHSTLVPALRNAPDWSPHAEELEGGYALRADGPSGAWIASRRAPLVEAERMLSGSKPDPGQPLVMIGCGTGIGIQKVRAKHPKSPLIVLETRLPLLRVLFSVHDLSQAISENLLFFPFEGAGVSMPDVLEVLELSICTFKYQLVKHSYTTQLQEYSSLLEHFNAFVTITASRIHGRIGNAKMTIANLLNNVPHYLQSRGVAAFKDVLKDVPGVLIASGPSLDKCLPLLKEHGDKAFIIAASSALHRARRAGVPVHATNIVDYHHLSKRYFSDLGVSAPPLFGKVVANFDVLDDYAGPKFLSDDVMLSNLLGNEFEARGEVGEIGGLNVSHHSYQVLRHLGCNPIILIGQDLAYSHHITHAPGTAIHDELMGSVHRYASLEQIELMNVTSPKARSTTQDRHGKPLGSCIQWDRAALVFEQWIRKYPDTRVINASSDGRAIAGAESMELSEVFSELITKPADLSAFEAAVAHATDDALQQDVERGAKLMGKAQSYTRELIKLLAEGEKELTRVYQELQAGRSADPRGIKQKIHTKLKEWEGLASMIGWLSTGELMEWNRLSAKLANDALPTPVRNRMSVEADLEYTTGFLASATNWMSILERAVIRMDRAASGKSLASEASTERPSSTDATKSDAWPKLIGSVQRRVVDAYLEMPDNEQVAHYVIGDANYSPLKLMLRSLLALPDIRAVMIPWQEAWGTPPVQDERLYFVEAPADTDLPSRPIANRLRAWNHAGTTYGMGASFEQATYGNPMRIMKVLADPKPDAVVVVPWHSGFMTSAAVQSLIKQAVETGFSQQLYISEGPVGLSPVIWSVESLESIVEQGMATYTAFRGRGVFWGPDIAYSPAWLKACRRNFDLRTVRGRNACEALAYKLGKDFDPTHPDALKRIVDAANADWESWIGGMPQDIEIELTTRRELFPTWLPDMKREPAELELEHFARWIEEMSAHRSDVNLTLGGFGDPLLHPQLIEMIQLARPHVRGLGVRTFGTNMTAQHFQDMANAGVDVVCLRLGAWGEQEYAAANGADLLMQVGGLFSQLGNWMMQNNVKMPILVPEVVRQDAFDHQLLNYWDAWWSPASWPMISGFNTYGDELENAQSLPLRPSVRQPCLRLTEQMLVFADGRVPLCIADHGGANAVGDLTEQSIAGVWRSDGFRKIRDAHLASDWSANAACENCNEWCRLS